MEVPCLAIADGYIERVIIGYNGYGRGLFIRLNDGNLAVYGHLERFSPEIEQLIRATQFEQDKYALRLKFTPDQYPVKSGQILATSGTSGTEHPHLHFEIRDSLNQALNPQLFYPRIKDTKAPVLDEILWIPATPDSRINGSHHAVIKKVQQSPEPIAISGPFQVAINAHDRADGTFNKYNIYEAETFINDSLSFRRTFDEVPMRHSDHVELIYPGVRGKRGWRFMSMFTGPSDSLSLFAPSTLSGTIQPTGLSTLKVKVRDIHQNETSGELPFRYQAPAQWTLAQVNDSYVINRHYSQNGYERFQFYTEDKRFIPVVETLYRLHSTSWTIKPTTLDQGIRALGTVSGSIKWILPPPSQPIPELEYRWFTHASGYYLELRSTEDTIFPLAYRLSGSAGDFTGELTQTSPKTAETDIIPLDQRALSHTIHLISADSEFVALPLAPLELLPPRDSLAMQLPELGITLQGKNLGETNLYLALDTLSSQFDGERVPGVSLSLVGQISDHFSATLIGQHPGTAQGVAFFTPGKKQTWKRTNSLDSLGQVSLDLTEPGPFFLLNDQSAPVVKPVSPTQTIKQGQRMVFKISDNTGRIPHPAKNISATLNGERFFPDYNPLRKELSFHAPPAQYTRKYTLSVSVTDESGNICDFTYPFSVRP